MILSPSIKTIDVRNYLKPEMLEGLANEEYGRVREELGNVFIQLHADRDGSKSFRGISFESN